MHAYPFRVLAALAFALVFIALCPALEEEGPTYGFSEEVVSATLDRVARELDRATAAIET